MNRLFYCTFMMAVLWLLIGCGGAPSGPTSVSRLPATDVRWPETKLRLPWNGESYRVPEPVVIPHQRLADGLEAWDRHRSAAWSILLEDGRTAVVATTRDQAAVLSMDSISVYRRDGSLQLEQRNDKGMPNAPGHWIVYERDGRTRHAEVFTARTADRERRYISQVIVYRSDTPSRRYVCSQDGVVQYEDRFNADGSTTTINARDGVLQPRSNQRGTRTTGLAAAPVERAPVENSPAATPTADGARVVEIDGTRLTLLGVSGGVTFVDKDGEKSGDQKRQYVKAVFLIEGKAGGIGELKINGQPRKTVHPDSAALSASIQVDHARAHWPAAERMEKIPEHAKDTDVIFEQTHIGVEPLPPKLSVSLEIGGRTFEFVDVSP